MHTRSVVIIDDHEMMRAGLAARLSERWRVTGEAGSLDEASTLFADPAEWPDLVILDIELGKEWGIDLPGLLRKKNPEENKILPPFLVYSVYDDYAHINAALRAGIKSYVCKSQSADELLEAMENAVCGKKSFNSNLVHRMAAVSDLILGLTRREREIFNKVQHRFSNKEIAASLGVSLRTIENNLSILYDKTGVKNRRELEQL